MAAPSRGSRGDYGQRWGEGAARCFSIESDPFDDDESVRLTPIPECFICPMSQTPMEDPVMTVDGCVYERSYIEQWIRHRQQHRLRVTSPATNQELPSHRLVSLTALQKAIEAYLAHRPELRGSLNSSRSFEEAAQMLQSDLLEKQAAHVGAEDELSLLRDSNEVLIGALAEAERTSSTARKEMEHARALARSFEEKLRKEEAISGALKERVEVLEHQCSELTSRLRAAEDKATSAEQACGTASGGGAAARPPRPLAAAASAAAAAAAEAAAGCARSCAPAAAAPPAAAGSSVLPPAGKDARGSRRGDSRAARPSVVQLLGLVFVAAGLLAVIFLRGEQAGRHRAASETRPTASGAAIIAAPEAVLPLGSAGEAAVIVDNLSAAGWRREEARREARKDKRRDEKREEERRKEEKKKRRKEDERIRRRREDEKARSMVSEDDLPIARQVATLREGTQDEKTQAALVLGILATASPENQAAIVRAGAVAQLVQLLKGDAPEARGQAAVALRALAANNTYNKVAIVRAGAIPPLIRLLKDEPVEVQEVAAGALQTLAETNNQVEIAQAGAIVPLVALLKDERPGVREEAAGALVILALNTDNQVAIAQVGAVPLLVDLLKDDSAEVREQAAAALRNLAAENADNQAAIARAGAFSPLADLLKDDLPGVREEALAALRNLAGASGEEAVRDAAAAAGVAIREAAAAAGPSSPPSPPPPGPRSPPRGGSKEAAAGAAAASAAAAGGGQGSKGQRRSS